MSSPLDERDIAILKKLVENSRSTYVEIARSLGISDVAVLKRVRKLEQLGIIKRYTIDIDYSKLGYTMVSYTGIDVDAEHLFLVLDKLKSLPNVKFIAMTSGDHSIITKIVAKDSDELARVHNEISRFPGVKRVCPAIVLQIVKDEKL